MPDRIHLTHTQKKKKKKKKEKENTMTNRTKQEKSSAENSHKVKLTVVHVGAAMESVSVTDQKHRLRTVGAMGVNNLANYLAVIWRGPMKSRDYFYVCFVSNDNPL